MSYNKYLIDDGFYSHLVADAKLYGSLEIPCLKYEEQIIVPDDIGPFDKRNKLDSTFFVHFYMHDTTFKQFMSNTDRYVIQLSRFKGIITPDCSLYRDMPLNLQITNTYFNRACGCYLQSNGLYVIPNVRWGDERSYLPLFDEIPFAFAGIQKNHIVSISTHGCLKGSENKRYFREGLRQMINYLEPKVVIVHGKMPDDIFGEFYHLSRFINYQSWIGRRHANG